MKEKHEKGLSFGWTRELPCPSPAGAVLLSRVFRAKPVSMFLGIKVLFFFPAEAGASCDAQVLFLALNLDFHFLVSVPLFIMCTCGQLQTTQKYPEESLPQGRRLSITKHVGIVPSCSSPVTEMWIALGTVTAFFHSQCNFSHSEFWSPLFGFLYH